MRKTPDIKRHKVVELYRQGDVPIKDIMRLAGVPSEQTVYAILDEAGVPRMKTRKAAKKISITIDEELNELIKEACPKNTSKWICEMAKIGFLASKG